MGIFSQTPQGLRDNDIAKQPYDGPSVASAMAGEGFIAHFKWALIAIGAVGGAALVFRKPAASILDGMRNWAHGLTADTPVRTLDRVKSGFGHFTLSVFGHGEGQNQVSEIYGTLEHAGVHRARFQRQEYEVGLGLWIFNHTLGLIRPLRNMLHEGIDKNPHLQNAFSAAGPFAILGYFVLPLFMSGEGLRKGRAGRQQFERAKDEIVGLRAENADLRTRNSDLRTRLTGIEHGTGSRLRDDQPSTPETTSPAPEERRWTNTVAAQEAAASQTKENALA